MDCFDVRSGDWRIGADCRSMSGMFALEEDISDLHRSPCRSLLCLCGLCSVMKYSQQATLTPLKAAAKSVSVSHRRKSSHYARTAIVLRISSIEGGWWWGAGGVSPPDKHPQSTAASLCSAVLIQRPAGNNRGVFAPCMSEKRLSSYPSVGKWLAETLLLVETNISKPVGCTALINLMRN